MSDGKSFEDKMSVEDLMKKPQKELLTMIYIQTVKTNGTVQDHEDRIDCLEKDNKSTIKTKIFVLIASVLGIIITLFGILDYLKR